MSRCKYPPILNLNGASYQSLYEQYHRLYKTLEQAELNACSAFPHGRDFQTSPDPAAIDKARQEFRDEVCAKVSTAKDFINDLLLDLVRQQDERRFRRSRR